MISKIGNGDGTVTVRGGKRKIYCIFIKKFFKGFVPVLLSKNEDDMTDLRAPLTKGCRYIFLKDVGSGCGSVGRAVASDRGLRFESSHW